MQLPTASTSSSVQQGGHRRSGQMSHISNSGQTRLLQKERNRPRKLLATADADAWDQL